MLTQWRLKANVFLTCIALKLYASRFYFFFNRAIQVLDIELASVHQKHLIPYKLKLFVCFQSQAALRALVTK